jgi:hypothetical protein
MLVNFFPSLIWANLRDFSHVREEAETRMPNEANLPNGSLGDPDFMHT